MTDYSLLLSFVVAATVLAMTPGVDTAMVLRAAAASGARAAMQAAKGIVLGCLLWGAAVSLGLGALLQASDWAYTLVKWAGAAYLMWLGLRLLYRPRAALDLGSGARPSGPAASPFWRGFLTNLLNPKVGVFYITFLPQFVPAGASVAAYSFMLACLHVLLSLLWFCLLIAATTPLRGLLQRPAVVKTLDRLTGGIFVAFGLRLAIAR